MKKRAKLILAASIALALVAGLFVATFPHWVFLCVEELTVDMSTEEPSETTRTMCRWPWSKPRR